MIFQLRILLTTKSVAQNFETPKSDLIALAKNAGARQHNGMRTVMICTHSHILGGRTAST